VDGQSGIVDEGAGCAKCEECGEMGGVEMERIGE